MTPMEGTDTILALFRRRILGQYPAAPYSPGPFVLLLISRFLSCSMHLYSEAWGPPQFQEKRSRSEKAILGALGEFRGILGAALGIRNSILGIRNSILGMASYDLINTKPTILGATLGAIPGIAANPHEICTFGPAFSERFFRNWGGPRAPDFENNSDHPHPPY